MRKLRPLLALLVTLAVALGGWGPSAASAAPAAPPFTDPSAVGYLGFCNPQNQQIRTGSLDAFPFVAKVVSSTAAPKGYTYPHGRATLYAYQPLQYVDPGDWSGKQMSGASVFSNNSAPMVAEVNADPSLQNFTVAFPLHWDGYAQLRVYYTAANALPFDATYPAAVLKVVGTTWTQVGGGKVDCASGRALSDEIDLREANRPQVPGGAIPAHGTKRAATAGSSASSSGRTGAASGPTAPGTDLQAAGDTTHRGGGSSGALGVVGAVIVAVLALAALTFVLRRRRAGAAESG